MRGPLDIDDVEGLELTARSPMQHRAAADRLVAWAQERHPDDDEEVTPALLPVKAGEHRGLAGDRSEAVEILRRAVTAEGQAPPDVRCYLHHGLIAARDVEAAHSLADEVRRSKPADPDVYVFLGEDYEIAGDLVEANRWLNLGLRRLLSRADDETEALSGLDADLPLVARRRVRQALGFPPDGYDGSALLPPVAE